MLICMELRIIYTNNYWKLITSIYYTITSLYFQNSEVVASVNVIQV